MFDTIFQKKQEQRELKQARIELRRLRADMRWQFKQWLRTCRPSKKLVPCADVYAAYCAWCWDQGFETITQEWFGRWLVNSSRTVQHIRKRINGRLVWHYKGICNPENI